MTETVKVRIAVAVDGNGDSKAARMLRDDEPDSPRNEMILKRVGRYEHLTVELHYLHVSKFDPKPLVATVSPAETREE